MVIPLQKTIITVVRYTLRPVNKLLIQTFKAQLGQEYPPFGYRFFVAQGQFWNRFEIAMNRIIIKKKGLGEIQKMKDNAAFLKGVDYFTEVVFYYGVMLGLAYYELNKYAKAGAIQKQKLQTVKNNLDKYEEQSQIATTSVESIKLIQVSNKDKIEELDKRVESLLSKAKDK